MKTPLNYLADFAAWAGNGDHFVGFFKIAVVILILAIVLVIAL